MLNDLQCMLTDAACAGLARLRGSHAYSSSTGDDQVRWEHDFAPMNLSMGRLRNDLPVNSGGFWIPIDLS